MKLVSIWAERLRDVTVAHWVAALCLAVLAVGVQAVTPDDHPRQPAEAHWVASWAVAPVDFTEMAAAPGGANYSSPAGNDLRGQTLRQKVELSLDGERIRIRFSNRFGKTPLRIAAASAARGTGADAFSPTTLRVLRFGGRTTMTIAPGADAWSDGIDLPVQAGQTVVVSAFFDRTTPFATASMLEPGATWVAPGNAVMAPKLKNPSPLVLNQIVTGLDVLTTKSVRTVVAFGDSITMGTSEGNFGAYPDMLATRLRDTQREGQDVAVLNAGIGGNRLLANGLGPSGLSRFELDALRQSSVTHAIILMGTNDIGRTLFAKVPGAELKPRDMPTAERITEGLEQLVKQARAKGVKVLLGTVPPFRNTPYWSEGNEAMREAVNRWIRGQQDIDGVVDFDAALRDPADPKALNPLFDSGDHLHPNKAGHAAMATAIDLRELQE
ncbi:SGNH/GDSL hydrolase family protein [Variovorax sp. R-27]|jgi:lysophospholipase L1-like esterase|uniref:SGNH/GDSL hydrolase family protein n=1 Tax=Variovorax sp. R-27 TaxID=3404058 RepID=UPI003CEF3C91